MVKGEYWKEDMDLAVQNRRSHVVTISMNSDTIGMMDYAVLVNRRSNSYDFMGDWIVRRVCEYSFLVVRHSSHINEAK